MDHGWVKGRLGGWILICREPTAAVQVAMRANAMLILATAMLDRSPGVLVGRGGRGAMAHGKSVRLLLFMDGFSSREIRRTGDVEMGRGLLALLTPIFFSVYRRAKIKGVSKKKSTCNYAREPAIGERQLTDRTQLLL